MSGMATATQSDHIKSACGSLGLLASDSGDWAAKVGPETATVGIAEKAPTSDAPTGILGLRQFGRVSPAWCASTASP